MLYRPRAFYCLSLTLLTCALLGDNHALAYDRARDLGIPFPGQPGPLNSITAVAGVPVGHTTLISGTGALARGA
ncbi:MAG: hypothetical protein ACO3IZ_10825, partial [Steroidobacteraceae bacterium]